MEDYYLRLYKSLFSVSYDLSQERQEETRRLIDDWKGPGKREEE